MTHAALMNLKGITPGRFSNEILRKYLEIFPLQRKFSAPIQS
jgi:hypothetical protein